MLRLLMVFGLFFGFLSNHAEAKTIRYEFDVVQSDIRFADFLKLKRTFVDGSPGASYYEEDPVSWETGEYEYYLRKLHPLGGIYGLAGQVVMDLHVSSSGVPGFGGPGESGSISCVSGFLCLLNPVSLRGIYHIPGFVLEADISTSFGGLSFYHNETHGNNFMRWDGGHSLGRTSCDYQPNCVVEYWLPSAYFSIANFSRTEIAPVPLPASASFLVVGMVIFGFKARRRKRAA